MNVERFLSDQLRKFTMVDFAFVKLVYFVVGLFIFSLYPKFALVGWVFYLVVTIFCAFPLYIHLFSQKGGLFQKAEAYLQTNNPSNQVLLFLSLFFFSLMIGSLVPVLVSASWWIYLVLIIVLAIKPLTKTWFW